MIERDAYDLQKYQLHNLYGLVDIYTAKNEHTMPQKIFIKINDSTSQETHDAKWDAAEIQKTFPFCKYVFSPLKFEEDRNHWIIRIYFEYPLSNLALKANRDWHHSLDEVLKFFHDILSVSEHYSQTIIKAHGDIRPDFIYYEDSSCNYIVSQRLHLFASSNVAQFGVLKNNRTPFTAPSLWNDLVKDENVFGYYDSGKVEVFTIGMVFLYLYLGEEITKNYWDKIYNKIDKTSDPFKIDEFQALLSIFQSKFVYTEHGRDDVLNFILQKILKIDEIERMDPTDALIELKKNIFPKCFGEGKIISKYGLHNLPQNHEILNDKTDSSKKSIRKASNNSIDVDQKSDQKESVKMETLIKDHLMITNKNFIRENSSNINEYTFQAQNKMPKNYKPMMMVKPGYDTSKKEKYEVEEKEEEENNKIIEVEEEEEEDTIIHNFKKKAKNSSNLRILSQKYEPNLKSAFADNNAKLNDSPLNLNKRRKSSILYEKHVYFEEDIAEPINQDDHSTQKMTIEPKINQEREILSNPSQTPPNEKNTSNSVVFSRNNSPLRYQNYQPKILTGAFFQNAVLPKIQIIKNDQNLSNFRPVQQFSDTNVNLSDNTSHFGGNVDPKTQNQFDQKLFQNRPNLKISVLKQPHLDESTILTQKSEKETQSPILKKTVSEIDIKNKNDILIQDGFCFFPKSKVPNGSVDKDGRLVLMTCTTIRLLDKNNGLDQKMRDYQIIFDSIVGDMVKYKIEPL